LNSDSDWLMEWGWTPTIYVQGRSTQAPFWGGIDTCTGETPWHLTSSWLILLVMNFYSQLPELHHLTCRSPWDLTCVTFLYRWLSPCFTSSTLTVRSVPTGCTGRVFHALRGKHLAPQLPHTTDLWGVRVRALWRSPLQSDCHCSTTPGPRRLVRLEFYLLGISGGTRNFQ
jgi:hypothetical protein